MKKSIKLNYIYNVSYQILSLITPLITTPYISRVLGASGVGVISYTESIVSYFVVISLLGTTTYGQREISYVQDSLQKRSLVFWNVKTLSVCTSTLALVLYLLFASIQSYPPIYLIFSLNILASAADITWFFQGLEEFGKIVFRNILFKIINIAYVFLVVRTPSDINLYAFGHAFVLFLSNVSLWGIAPKYITKVRLKDLQPFKDFRTVFSLFIPTMAVQVYTFLDKTMIGIITQDAVENGYYEQALKITKMVLTIITSLGTVMIPRIGYYYERRDTLEVRRLMVQSYRFVWFLGVPLCLGLIMVANNFVPWFLGPGYDKVADLLSVLSFLILVIGVSNVTGIQFLVPTKRQNILSKSVILGAVTNFALNLFLIRGYGAIGAAIASVTAEAVVTVSQLYFVRKELSVVYILKESIPYLASGIVMSVGLYLIGNALVPSIINTVILVACGAAIYFGMLLVLRDEFFMSNLIKICAKLKK